MDEKNNAVESGKDSPETPKPDNFLPGNEQGSLGAAIEKMFRDEYELVQTFVDGRPAGATFRKRIFWNSCSAM